MCLTLEAQLSQNAKIIFFPLPLPCPLPAPPLSTAIPACHCTCAPHSHAATLPGLAAGWQWSPAYEGIHSPSPWTGRMHACYR